jgi:hypothetical protein
VDSVNTEEIAAVVEDEKKPEDTPPLRLRRAMRVQRMERNNNN